MKYAHRALPLAALILALTAGSVAAQQTSAAKPMPPATISANSDSKSDHTSGSSQASAKIEQTWDRTKTMTRKEWDAAKRKLAVEKVKWRDCYRQAEAEKLTAPKSWSFVAGCMTGS